MGITGMHYILGMQIKITSNTPASFEEWDSIARACPYATYFHTPHWAQLLCTQHRLGNKNAARKIVFSDGASAILPISSFKRIAWNINWSSPEGTYGGWISKDSLTREHANLLSQLLLSHGNLVWRENLFDPLSRDASMPGALLDFSHVFDTQCSPIADQLKKGSKGHLAAVKQAQAAGVTIRKATGISDWKKHYTAYINSINRWSSKGNQPGSRYSLELFEAMSKQSNITLWIAEQNDNHLSSMIALYWNQHAVYWHAASFSEFFHLRPNDLLLDTFIRDAAENGYRWIDLNPSGGYDSVARFKDHLGAPRVEHRYLFKRSGLSALVHTVRGLRFFKRQSKINNLKNALCLV